MADIITKTQLIMVFRMVLSCVCGIVIGYERKNRAKEAGIRTHCIVACASALMMILSKYGFFDMINGTAYPGIDVRLDPSRMAAGIITGVGFLGAGIIYIQRGMIRGLTTAAGVWAMSGIGMAIGAGEYFIGISATLIILFVQVVLHLNTRLTTMYKCKTLKFYDVDVDGFQQITEEKLKQMHIMVTDVSIEQNDEDKFEYSFCIEIPKGVNEETLVKMFDYRCKIDFTH